MPAVGGVLPSSGRMPRAILVPGSLKCVLDLIDNVACYPQNEGRGQVSKGNRYLKKEEGDKLLLKDKRTAGKWFEKVLFLIITNKHKQVKCFVKFKVL